MDRQKLLMIFGLAWVSAAVLTWFLYASTKAPKTEKTVRVVAAARDLPAGTRLAKADLKFVNIAERDLPRGSVTAANDVLGRAEVRRQVGETARVIGGAGGGIDHTPLPAQFRGVTRRDLDRDLDLPGLGGSVERTRRMGAQQHALGDPQGFVPRSGRKHHLSHAGRPTRALDRRPEHAQLVPAMEHAVACARGPVPTLDLERFVVDQEPSRCGAISRLDPAERSLFTRDVTERALCDVRADASRKGLIVRAREHRHDGIRGDLRKRASGHVKAHEGQDTSGEARSKVPDAFA